MMTDLFKIVDRVSGARSTVVSFLSRAQAEQQITSWHERHERGGRPAITRDTLLRMSVVPEDGRND